MPHHSLTGVIHTHVQYLLNFMLPLLHVSTPLFLVDPSLSWYNIKQQQNITPDTTSSYTGTIRPPKLLKLQNLCLGPCLINWKKTKRYLMIWINLVKHGQIQCTVEYLPWKTKEKEMEEIMYSMGGCKFTGIKTWLTYHWSWVCVNMALVPSLSRCFVIIFEIVLSIIVLR